MDSNNLGVTTDDINSSTNQLNVFSEKKVKSMVDETEHEDRLMIITED